MLGLLLRDAAVTERVVSRCLEHNVLLGWTLHSDCLVRIAPPLNIPWDALEEACEVIQSALEWAQKPPHRQT